jgi:iron complex transport system permease protein
VARSSLALLSVLIALSGACLVWAISSGSSGVDASDVLASLAGRGDAFTHTIVFELRLPRALSAWAVGGLLATAGALMQVLLRNPLADPYVLGVSGGAASAALIAMLLGVIGVALNLAAFGGALLAVVLVFGLARGRGPWDPARLLLTGVVLAAGWGALISFVLATSPTSALPGMLFWLMGDLSNASTPAPALIALLIGLAASLALSRSLNLLSLGDIQAAALGVEVNMVRTILYVGASLLTAFAVTLGGSIGFVGLVVPHMLRLAGYSDYRILLPAAALLGGVLLLGADTVARLALAPRQLPVGVITAALGVPLFLYLLQREHKA